MLLPCNAVSPNGCQARSAVDVGFLFHLFQAILSQYVNSVLDIALVCAGSIVLTRRADEELLHILHVVKTQLHD